MGEDDEGGEEEAKFEPPQSNENGSVNGLGVVGNGHAHPKSSSQTDKIDWEIPRKAFHSSIGTSSFLPSF